MLFKEYCAIVFLIQVRSGDIAMWQFIISGNIPGTTIQVNFDHVATVATILLMLFFSIVLLREHRNFRVSMHMQQQTPQPNVHEITL